MKRKLKLVAAALAAVMLLSTAAFAADSTGPSVTSKNGTVTLGSTGQTLTASYSGVTSGGQYLVLVVKANDVTTLDYTISQSNILYINQQEATGSTITFSNVYPSRMTNSVVLLTGDGLTGPVVLGAISVPYTVGDTNGDGKVSVYDAYLVAMYAAGKYSESDLTAINANAMDAGDANGDGTLTAADTSAILQYVVGSITTLPKTN